MAKNKEMVPHKPKQVVLVGNTKQEKLFERLKTFRRQPKIAGYELEFDDIVDEFAEAFIDLCWEHMDITLLMISKLKKRDLIEIANVLLEKLSPLQWHQYFTDKPRRIFIKTYTQLKNRYGSSFFPNNTIKQRALEMILEEEEGPKRAFC